MFSGRGGNAGRGLKGDRKRNGCAETSVEGLRMWDTVGADGFEGSSLSISFCPFSIFCLKPGQEITIYPRKGNLNPTTFSQNLFETSPVKSHESLKPHC